MKSSRIKNLFLELHILYGNIARFKLQNRMFIGFENKTELDRLNKLLEKSKKAINKYEDILFIEDSKENPKELVTLIKTLAKLDDSFNNLPDKAREDELFKEITTDITDIMNTVSQYNYLKEPELV